MSKKSKKYSAYYAYMEPFFEKGNEGQIQQAKISYRRLYKATWRKVHRKTIKEITVAWNREEYAELKAEAKKHGLSTTRFIKKSTIAYSNSRYIPLNQQEITRILQLVGLTYNRIEELSQEENINDETARELKNAINNLDQEMRVAFFSPKTIWAILTETLSENPHLKQQLILFIEFFGL